MSEEKLKAVLEGILSEAQLASEDETHAKFSPSKLGRLMLCPGSYEACKDKEEAESEYAKEGTQLHAIMEHIVQHIDSQTLTVNTDIVKVLIPDWRDRISTCVEYLEKVLSTCTLGATYVSAEERLVPDELPDCSGTVDVLIVDESKNKVIIIDWKFGKGLYVDIDSYSTQCQLKTYALAAYDAEYYAGHYRDVEYHIAQPAFNNFERRQFNHNDAKAWKAELQKGINNIHPNAPRTPGESQCLWCLNKPTCKELALFRASTAENVFEKAGLISKGEDVSIEELAKAAQTFGLLRKSMKAIEDYLASVAKAGQEVPGMKLVRGRNTRKWIDEQQAIEWLLANYEHEEELFETKLLTPAKTEKLSLAIKKNPDFHKLITKVSGSLILVPNSDRRKGVNLTTGAKEAFKEFI